MGKEGDAKEGQLNTVESEKGGDCFAEGSWEVHFDSNTEEDTFLKQCNWNDNDF